MTDYEVVTSYLKSLNIHYSKDWVLRCIEGTKSSNSFLSFDDLCSAIYQKWLLANLRDLKVASLPPNLLSREKIILTGSYAVQMESMMDSSKSSYSELCKIRDADKISEISEESKEETGSKRCLVFVFCDGVQEIQGMEYQHIPSFNLNNPGILPGIKILIVGPVICRKGMLLLKKDNVRIYGGKVESLCKINCLESLLCKKLGLNSNLKDNNSEKDVAEVDINCSEFSSDVATNLSGTETRNVIANNEVDELLSDDDDDILLSLTLDSNSFKDDNNEQSFNEFKSINQTEQRELKQKINEELSRHEHENQFFKNKFSSEVCKKSQRQEEISYLGKSKRPKIGNSSFANDIFKEETASQSDCINEALMFDPVLSLSKEGGSQINSTKDLGAKNFQMKISSYLSNEKKNSQFNNSHKKSPLIVSSYPFVYLKQIVGITFTNPTIFIVKAIILTLKSKIIMKNDAFALKAVISDGSYAIQVDFSSDVLENIMEYSPCEIASFKSEKNENSAINEKLQSIFLCVQEKLLSMNCLMEVKFFSDGHIPLIIGLEEIQLQHVNALKQRMLDN